MFSAEGAGEVVAHCSGVAPTTLPKLNCNLARAIPQSNPVHLNKKHRPIMQR